MWSLCTKRLGLIWRGEFCRESIGSERKRREHGTKTGRRRGESNESIILVASRGPILGAKGKCHPKVATSRSHQHSSVGKSETWSPMRIIAYIC